MNAHEKSEQTLQGVQSTVNGPQEKKNFAVSPTQQLQPHMYQGNLAYVMSYDFEGPLCTMQFVSYNSFCTIILKPKRKFTNK